MSTSKARWLPVLAVGVAMALRLIALGRKSMWLDEVVTLRIAESAVRDIISAGRDPHPPLYYILMHYWTALGRSELVARLPSALAGAAAIPLLYRLVGAWVDRWSATASAWLLAIAPLHIWYSQETRMYAPVCTLGLASALSYTLVIRRGGLAAVIAWIVATVTGLYTHYSMLVLVFVQIILFAPLWQASGSGRATLLPALAASLIACLLFLPQAYTFVNQLVVGGERIWLYLSLRSLLSQLNLTASPSQLHAITVTVGVIIAGIVVAAVWVLSRRLKRMKRIRVGKGLIAAAVVVYLLILVATAVPRGLGAKRQVLILLPYVLGGVAVVVSTQRYRARLLVGLILVTLPLTGHVVLAQEQEAWRDVARYLEQRASPQDVIVVSAPYMVQPLDYYYRHLVPRQGIRPNDVPDELAQIVSSHERVWLVLSNDRYTDPQGKIQGWLDENCTLLDERAFPKVRLRLYAP